MHSRRHGTWSARRPDLERYGPIITHMGRGNIAFGAIVGVIDWKAGMPTYWTLGESLPTMAMGVLILTLQRWERRGRTNGSRS